MITLKTLKWSNAFSYGEDNILELNKNPITQLIGFNGHGKSSIPLIIEEVCYNKNSKNTKRGDVLNRYVDAKAYQIELEFDKDGDTIVIKANRGSTSTVKLLKNGVDISSHTATATYKTIEELLGFDNKTFAQLIYQSSSSSLEFLTATDTNRKKFLIELFNLTKYTEAFEIFKALAKQVQDEVTRIESKVSTTQAWIDKNKLIDTNEIPLQVEPEPPTSYIEDLNHLKVELANIDSTNKTITQNNKYKELLDKVNKTAEIVELPGYDRSDLISKKAEAQKTVKDATAFVIKMQGLGDSCPTCLSKIDIPKVQELILDKTSEVKMYEDIIKDIDVKIKELTDAEQRLAKITKNNEEWEKYHALYNPETPNELLDGEMLEFKIGAINSEISLINREIAKVRASNLEAEKHNSKIEVILSQMDEMTKDLEVYTSELRSISERLTVLQILQKTFGTNGLPAYKIECLIKDLEDLANVYLMELSDGRFNISFVVNSSDKLNVVINDNGKEVDILALSSGERARVNTATLLAIRKLMQSLSNARINLLILDETIDTLDVDGKERLVEVLLNEPYLNTFLISHSYSHPLIEKISIVKENNISRIEA